MRAERAERRPPATDGAAAWWADGELAQPTSQWFSNARDVFWMQRLVLRAVGTLRFMMSRNLREVITDAYLCLVFGAIHYLRSPTGDERGDSRGWDSRLHPWLLLNSAHPATKFSSLFREEALFDLSVSYIGLGDQRSGKCPAAAGRLTEIGVDTFEQNSSHISLNHFESSTALLSVNIIGLLLISGWPICEQHRPTPIGAPGTYRKC